MSTQNLQVIKASAGSGKTFTLAKLYIERLLWDEKGELRCMREYHDHILAITFTNKATDEMKQRIVERLYELSIGTCYDYQDEFLKNHPTTTPEQLKSAALDALEDILFGYTTFNVSTIDSFFQVVLRTFAHELDREYDYELQLDGDYATRQAVVSMMMNLGDRRMDSTINRWLRDYVKSNVQGNKDWNMFGKAASSDLIKFAKVINEETFLRYREQINEYLSDMAEGRGTSRLQQFLKALIAKSKFYKARYEGFSGRLRDLISTAGIDLAGISGSTGAPLKKLLLCSISTKESLGESFKTLVTHAGEDDYFVRFFKKNQLTAEQAEQCAPIFCQGLLEFLDDIDRAEKLDAVVANMWKLGLMAQIDGQLEVFRKENNSILISDTNDLIAKVLKSGVPFLFERVGTWINHFMIDEFQDTSRKQYDNFRPLLENSLSNGYRNLIIGDEKQSIYRFRNSDPSLLQTELQQDFGPNYDDSTPLDTNYRSCRNVIEFNNKFFALLLQHYKEHAPQYKKLQLTYSNLEQKVPEKKMKSETQGYIRVNYIYSKGKTPGLKLSDEVSLHGKDQVIEMLPDYILDLHERLKYPFGKILILTNLNNEGVAVVERLLQHNAQHPDRHINIVSAESLLLKNSPTIRLIISVLQFINATQYHQELDEEVAHDPDKLEQLSAYEKMVRSRLSEQFRYKLLHDFGKALGTAKGDVDAGQLLVDVFRQNDGLREASQEDQMKTFDADLKSLLPDPKKELASLTGLVDKIIEEYLQKAGVTSEAETPFLLAFQGVIGDFCNQRNCGGTITEFLKYWEARKDKLAIASGEDSDAVEVMTIHKAKGLERECVLLPFVGWSMTKHEGTVWMPGEVWTSNNTSGKPYEDIGNNEAGECIVPPLIPVSDDFLSKIPEFADFYNPRMEDQLIDIVNKTYVAFTRPRQALHIFAMVGNGSVNVDNVNDIGRLISAYLPKVEGMTVSQFAQTHPDLGYDSFVDYCELGKEEVFVDDKKDEETGDYEPMPVYSVRPSIGLLHVKLPDVVTEQQDEGNRLHRLFSRIRWQRDADKALRYALHRRVIFDDDEHYWNLKRVQPIITEMFTHELTAEWFADDNKVYNERTIAYRTPQGEVCHCRPDRVVVRPDGTAIVVDYKFGDAPSDQQRSKYERQVKGYMSLLRQMGHQTVKGFLWYVKEGTIHQVQ